MSFKGLEWVGRNLGAVWEGLLALCGCGLVTLPPKRYKCSSVMSDANVLASELVKMITSCLFLGVAEANGQ